MKRHAMMVQGQLKLIPQLPPLKLLEFIDWLRILDAGNLSDEMHQAICDRCLELHGLNPPDFLEQDAIDLIVGPLAQLNKPEPVPAKPGAPAGDAVSIEDWAFSVVAALIETESLSGAIYAAETHPADLIAGVLDARAKQLKSADTPEDPPLDSPEYLAAIAELDKSIMSSPTQISDPNHPRTNDPTSLDC